ncbi:CDP-glycerol glycerophosphotransferase family protein [Salinivibrio kushneri]|uniref:CDP-glycerol glycerophosphotransferase family protein n=1 Tax=Salinivibrio kushneri TaxID=1908198 RepID=A0AA47LPZ3_9GAMM|nr:CDP-glycerol glycerophosphotransferase family protein [Salinivibrio kushneri]WBA07878.1 CDP-glycerol glycerophosphotransferase family protein [Salinivibrio kushneri]
MKTVRVILNRLRHGKLDYLIRLSYLLLCQCIGFFVSHIFLVRPKKAIFESFNGKNICDSPLALLIEMDRVLSGWMFVLVTNNKEEQVTNLTGNNKIIYVRFKSLQYYISYFTSKFNVVNCRLPYFIYKKSSQILIQTWHGVPLKKIGMDIDVDNHPTASKESIRLAYLLEGWRADYFLSSSDYLTDKLCSAFGIEEHKVVSFGLPRNDALVNSKSRIDIRKLLNIPPGKKVLLYAPTYRDTIYEHGTFSARNPLDCDLFCSRLSEEYVFLFRGHYFSEKNDEAKHFIDVSNVNDVNELLLVTDILVTDYSSVMFDYSILKRKMYFYHYDYEEYENETRGMYFDLREECSRIQSESIDELLYLINNEVVDENYLCWKERFMSFNNSKTSERIIRLMLSHCD